MQVKELLLVLNQASIKQGYTYILQYNYRYSEKYNMVYPKVLLFKFNVNNIHKPVSKIRIKGEMDTIQTLANEIQNYSRK